MKYKHNINLIYIIVSFAILATAFIIFEVNSNRVNERNLVGGATTTTLEHPIATSSNTDKELGKSSSYEQLSQEFKITASTPTYSLTGAKVYLMRYNSPTYPITVSIRSSLSGSNIVSTTITPTGLSTSSPTLVKVNFGSNTLKSGNTYYLTLSVSSTDIHNYYKWTLSSANPYEDGYFYRETTRYSSYDAYATILYTLSSPPPPPPSTCSDGTAINQCSSTKPLYCNSALQLVNNCGSCGCSAGYTCQSDGACIITPITQTSGIQTINNILPNTDRDFSILGGDNVVVSPSVNGIKIDATTQTSSASSVYLNVKDFGAIPDDDIDDTDAIQAAIDSVGQNIGTADSLSKTAEIIFPQGTYYLSRPIKTYTGITLVGFGRGSTLRATTLFDGDTLISLERIDNYYQAGRIKNLHFVSQSGSGIAAIRGGAILSEFRDLYLDTAYGLMFEEYSQEIIVDNILSTGPVETLLYLVGNANTVKNIFKEGWGTGSSPSPYIQIDGLTDGVQPSRGNYFENIVIEGLTSASKSAMVINHGQAMTIHNFWSEPSNVDGPPDPDTDGYMLRIVNSSSVKVTGNLVLVRSENKIQVLNSNVILDAFIDAEQYYPNRSDWLEVDSNSKVTMPFQTTSQNSLRISDPDAKTRDVKLEFNTFGGLWTIRPNAGGGNRFGIIDIFNEEVLSILSGNIGIGTTVPDTALSIRKGNQLFAIGGSGSAYSEISLLLPSGAVGNSRSVIAEGSGTTPRLTFGGGYEGLYGTTFEVRTDISRAGSAGTGYPNLGQALVVKRTSQDGTTNNVLSTIGVTKLYPLTSDGIQLATWDAGPPSLTVSKATGNVGIGTTSPNAKLQVVDGDAAVTTQGNGLILRATNGANCFRLTVNNAGTLSTTAIACP